MILGRIDNIQHYLGISKNIDTIINFILNNDLNKLPEGKTVIDDHTFVSIFNYDLSPEDTGLFEGHYLRGDLHFTLSGKERMYFSDEQDVTVSVPYDKDKDVYLGTSDKFIHYDLDPNHFALTLKADAHQVKVFCGDTHVKKIVFKFDL